MTKLESLTFAELKDRLSPSALSYFDPTIDYAVTTVPAIDLITADRFDLGVKAFFFRSYIDKKQFSYYRQLYLLHLAVWNGFFEAVPAKFGAEDYIRSFSKLCEEASQLNFEEMLIPVDQAGALIDGAHRVCIAAVLGRRIRIVRSARKANAYDYRFFERCVSANNELPEAAAKFLIDQMAYYFALFKPSVRAICVMPSTAGRFSNGIEAAIENCCSIVFKKTLKLSPTLFNLFILNLYFEDSRGWVGTFSDGFKGAEEKAKRCYSDGQELTVYFVDSLGLAESVALKQKIRSFFTLGNDSCHITDSHNEMMSIAGLILNPAWDILSKVKFSSQTSNLERGLNALLRHVHESGISPLDFCLVGSTLWGLTGCRDCGDIDLAMSREIAEFPLPEGVECNNLKRSFYSVSFDEIINDPRYHFSFLGFKFARPEVMLQFKRNRNEIPKDPLDIASLSAVFANLPTVPDIFPVLNQPSSIAKNVLERTIRDQQQLIARLENDAHLWSLREIEDLARRLSEAYRRIAESDAREAKAQAQIAQLERALEQAGKSSNVRSYHS